MISLLIELLGFIGLFSLTFIWPFWNKVEEVIGKQASWLSKLVLSVVLGFSVFIFAGLLALRFGIPVWVIRVVYLLVGGYHVGRGVMSKGILEGWRSFWDEVRRNVGLVLILIIGGLNEAFMNLPSGWFYKDGLYFYSSHGHDGVWHLALMEQIQKGRWPIMNPTMGGHRLVNYHFFSDLLMGYFGSLWPFFGNLDLYFRWFSLVWAFLLGLSIYVLVWEVGKRKKLALWAMWLTYFGGSFGYVVNFLHRQPSIAAESKFWASQTNTVVGNPPIIISFIYLAVLSLLVWWVIERRSKKIEWLLVLIGWPLAMIKVYAAVVFLGGLVGIYLFNFVKDRKFLNVWFWSGLMLGLISLVLIKTNTVNTSGFLIFKPLWLVWVMMVAPDRVNWITWELRRQVYTLHHNIPRLIEYWGGAVLIFIVGNVGIKSLGFLAIVRKWWRGIDRKVFEFWVFFGCMVAVSVVMPLLFIQKGVAWNTVQFIQYTIFLMAVPAAWVIARLQSAWKGWVYIVILLAIPTVIGNQLEFYYYNGAPARIDYQEWEALRFLKQQPDEGYVLAFPFNKYLGDKFNNPKPMLAYNTTAYVSAFSGKETYVSGLVQLDIMGYDIKERLNNKYRFFDFDKKKSSVKWKGEFLKQEKVGYIYIPLYAVGYELKLPENVKLIFDNGRVKIYRVI